MNKEQFLDECMTVIKEKFATLSKEDKEDALEELQDRIYDFADEEVPEDGTPEE